MQVKSSRDTVISIDASRLSKADNKVAVLETEIDLLSNLSNSNHIDHIVDYLSAYINDRWGFNIFGLQFCDHQSHKLIFHKLVNADLIGCNYSSLDNFSLCLDNNKSISILAAIDKRFKFHDLDNIDEYDYDFDARITAKIGLKTMLFIPIINDNVSIGVIRLSSSNNSRKFSPEVVDQLVALISKISGIVAVKLQINQIEQQFQLQQRNLQLINDLSSISDLKRISELLIQEILAIDAFDAIMVNMLDSEKRTYICKNLYLPGRFSPMQNVLKGYQFKFEADALDNSWNKTHKPVTIESNQFSFCSPFIKERCQKWEMQYLVVIPIIVSGLSVGSLCIFNRANSFSANNINAISDSLNLFSAAINNATKIERVNAKEEELLKIELAKKKFLKFIEKINHISEPKKIYQNIADEFIRWFSFNMVSIHMVEGENLLTKNITLDETVDPSIIKSLKLAHDEIKLEMKAGESVQVSTILNDSITHIPDVLQIKDLPMPEKDAYCLKFLNGLRTVVHIPVRIGSNPVGVLSLWSFGEVISLSEDDIDFIEMIASFCGSTINNAFLFNTVEEQNIQIAQQYKELCNTRDLLEVARDEAQFSANAKSEFLANMSHEIRTPMNAIINFAELALKTGMTPKQIDYIAKIQKSSDSLLCIINDILDLSKIEANKFTIDKNEFDLIEVINDVTDMFVERLRAKGLEFYINGAALIKNCFWGDALRIKQVLINLINNAFKFTHEGYIELGIINQQSADNQKSVLEFYVKDTGIGISAKKADQLFDSFTQADSSITREYGGTGLGLTISKQLCHMMGGKIWVDSKVGKGSSFHFTISLDNSLTDNLIDKQICDDICNKRVVLISNIYEQSGSFLGVLGRLNSRVDYVNSINELRDYIKGMQTDSDGVELIIIDEGMYDHKSIDLIAKLISLTGAKCLVLQSIDNHDSYLYCDAIGTKPLNDSALIELIVKIYKGNKENTLNNNDANISSIERKYYSKLCNNNVLLVDDNDTNLQIGQELLELVGLNVTAVNSGLKAINALNKNKFELVITDVQMPHMDGYKLTSIIRENFSDIPVIALTAHAMQGYKEQCIASGMNDYISKPISQVSLYKCLGKWLKPKVSQIELDVKDELHNVISKNTLSPSQFDHISLASDIDINSALESIGCSRKLFVKILRTISKQYKDSPLFVRKRLSENDIDGALSRIHSLKGLVGTIAAQQLYNTCKLLEATLVEHQTKFRSDIFTIIDKFENEFEIVLEDISAIITYTILLSDSDIEHVKSNDKEPADKNNNLETFKKLIEENNYRSLEYMPFIKKHFENDGNVRAIANIESAIESFDFATARHIFYNYI